MAQTRRVHGRFAEALKRPRLLVSFSGSKLCNETWLKLTTGSSSSDFENKFVCGEIMTYDDLREYGSEAAVKAVSFSNIRVGYGP